MEKKPMPSNNDEIDRILEESKTIAVIGMSKNPEKDAYTVPEFLQKKGYRVIPVNPSAGEILGERA
jgi:predicted CoA-binding protein